MVMDLVSLFFFCYGHGSVSLSLLFSLFFYFFFLLFFMVMIVGIF